MAKMCVVLMAVVFPCLSGSRMILKAKDVQFFDVQQTRVHPHASISISGLAFHSSMIVESMSATVQGNTMLILVSMSPARGKGSGRFQYSIEIPDKAVAVEFGNGKTVIWTRKSDVR
jgi:hypothetical protein